MTWTRPWTAVAACALCIWLATAAPAFADTATFSQSAPTSVCLQDFGTPYPSTIDVSGMNGPTSAVTVTLGQYNTPGSTLDVLLVSPAGKTVLILSDFGSEGPVDITLDDAASQSVPGPAITGTFKPTDNDSGPSPDTFTGAAPAEPYGTTMSALNGDSPNGTWNLYVAENPATMPGCGSADGSIATWSLNLTTTPPAVTPPVDQPPPPDQPAPRVDPTAPQILSAEFSKPPVAGQQTFLQVVARDPDSRISGLMVDFGEALGLWAESACIQGQTAAGGTVQFDVPYRYLAPGPRTITITVLSGGCGHSQATQQTRTVTVAGAAASRTARASVSIPGPTVTSKCKNARMAPTRVGTKAIVTALLCVMNEQRKLFKLKPLKNSKRLSKAALAHTRAMILGGFFAHQGPSEPALVARLRKVKFIGAAGENIGAGASSLGTPVAMVDGWMHSPLHRANLLEKRWRAVGIGFLAQYPIKTAALPVATYTTDFGPKP